MKACVREFIEHAVCVYYRTKAGVRAIRREMDEDIMAIEPCPTERQKKMIAAAKLVFYPIAFAGVVSSGVVEVVRGPQSPERCRGFDRFKL